jgi:hypothetical protein
VIPKAIETVYNGYRFRSRLEARWAVFFDAAGIKYEYEPEGYDLGSQGWYLPDFWLKDLEMWLEVKGFLTEEEREFRRCEALWSASERPVLLGVEGPWYGSLFLYCNDTTDSGGGSGWWPAWWIDGFDGARPCLEVDVYRTDRCLCDYNWKPLTRYIHHHCEPGVSFWAKNAADKARQARFEHGQNGAP